MSLVRTVRLRIEAWLARRRRRIAHHTSQGKVTGDSAMPHDEHVIPVVCIEYGGVARFAEIRIMPELHLHG